MVFKIEKGVPLPEDIKKRTQNESALSDLPLDSMNKGDSILVPLKKLGVKAQSLRVKVLRYKKNNPGTQFSVVTKNLKGDARVYRTK